jgi:hypothetical protein
MSDGDISRNANDDIIVRSRQDSGVPVFRNGPISPFWIDPIYRCGNQPTFQALDPGQKRIAGETLGSPFTSGECSGTAMYQTVKEGNDGHTNPFAKMGKLP